MSGYVCEDCESSFYCRWHSVILQIYDHQQPFRLNAVSLPFTIVASCSFINLVVFLLLSFKITIFPVFHKDKYLLEMYGYWLKGNKTF